MKMRWARLKLEKIWVRDGENKEDQKRGSQWEERVGYESSLLQ